MRQCKGQGYSKSKEDRISYSMKIGYKYQLVKSETVDRLTFLTFIFLILTSCTPNH